MNPGENNRKPPDNIFILRHLDNRIRQDFIDAALGGDAPAVQEFLDGGIVDPTIYQDAALKGAARNGRVEVVRILLRDGTSNPATSDCEPLVSAARNRHAEVVRLILKDGRAAAGNDRAIQWGIMNDDAHVVQTFLEDEGFDPAADDKLILVAAADNKVRALQVLLKDGRADPAARGSLALRTAVRRGFLDVARFLLEDGRVDPAAEDHRAIKQAVANGHVAILPLLLSSYPDRNVRLELVDQLLEAYPASAVRDPAWAVHDSLLAYKSDPTVSRTIDCIHVLLKMHLTGIHTGAMLSLALALARRNIKTEELVHLHEQGHFMASLQGTFGRNLAVPSLNAMQEARGALAPLASASKASPIMRQSEARIDPNLISEILYALAPGLPPVVARGVWQMLRKEILYGPELEGAASPAERLHGGMISDVIGKAIQAGLRVAVKECDKLHDDTRALERHANHHLASIAHRLNLALDVLKAVIGTDIGAVATAQQNVESSLDLYQKAVRSVLGDKQYQERAYLFEVARSIVRTPAADVSALQKAQRFQRARGMLRQGPEIAR